MKRGFVSRRTLLKRGAVLALAPLFAACGGSAPPKAGAPPESREPAGATEASAEATPAQEGPEWSYQGDDGPERWGDVDPSFAACASGREQSPINLSKDGAPSDFESIEFRYQPTRLNIVNNGHTVLVKCDPGSFLSLDGQQFELEQFHFHVPSEHHLHGLEFPMEAHLVHRADDGRLAVVAVLFYGGVIDKPNIMAAIINAPTLDAIWQDIPGKGAQVAPTDSVNTADLLPVDRHYVTYEGSLTTPPCTEGVRWIVFTTPKVVSLSHLEKFRSMIGADNRPLQPLNGRLVQSGYAHAAERKPAS